MCEDVPVSTEIYGRYSRSIKIEVVYGYSRHVWLIIYASASKICNVPKNMTKDLSDSSSSFSNLKFDALNFLVLAGIEGLKIHFRRGENLWEPPSIQVNTDIHFPTL